MMKKMKFIEWVTVIRIRMLLLMAIVENKDKGGLYLSNDGGESWGIVNSERKLRQRAWGQI